MDQLSMVAETRFASHTIVLRRLVRVKEALCQMVISNKWGGWKQVDTEKAKIVKDLIFNDDFWNRVEYALELTEPLMSMLRYADTDEPCLGNIYDAMDSMLERMKSVIQRREQDPDTLYSTVEKIVLHRWNKMTTPLHLLAYALSPRYYSSEILDIPGRVPPYRDPEVAAGYKRALSKLFSDPDVASNVRREFVDFVSGKFAEPDAINDQSRLDAIGWWYLHGERYMYLQPLAIKILSQAGELARLIKDNLPCKHLILSAEETFLEFLAPSSSLEDILELEPMISYHRMLLHRLADIFGLAHESVGEGDDRHLIVERCHDSSIPAILVSDILEWQYGETQSQQAACQLLKRKIALPDLQQKQTANQLPSISFEEREAAYLAARERIFSLSSCEENDEQKELTTPRPRTVPLVARRMIAHALGKRIMVDASCEKPDIPKITEAPQVNKKAPDKCLNGALSQVHVQHAVKASSEEPSSGAVKIMINNCINGDVSCSNGKAETKVEPADIKAVQRNSGDLPHVVGAPHFTNDGLEHLPVKEAERVPVRILNSKIPSMDDKLLDKSLISNKPYLDEKLPDKSWIDTSEVASGVQQPVKASLGHMPVAAAKRMFAQALGLPLANGPLKSTIESTSRLGIGSSKTSATETFEDDTSYQNSSQFKVGVEQDKTMPLASKARPEELHQSRADFEPPSTSESQLTNPGNQTGWNQSKHIPGRAAQRLFAQALGIQSVSSTCVDGNRSRNSLSTSTALRGLPAGHKPGASFGPSNAIHTLLTSDSGTERTSNDECQNSDSNPNNFLAQIGDQNEEGNSEATIHVDLNSSESCENIDPERHSPGSSLKQLGDERVFSSSVSYKSRKNFQVNTNNFSPKNFGRARRMNNSGPIKTKHSNYRIASTCSTDETGIVSL